MTRTIHYRRGTIDDRDAILALRDAAFAGVDATKRDPAFWDWAFRRGYAGQALLFVAQSDDRVIGHFAVIPQRYVTPSGDAEGALGVDAMVHPQFHRRHVFSNLTKFAAAELRDRVAFCLAFQIRKASLGGMLAGGWRAVDRLPVLIKPLSMTAIARDLGVSFLRGRSGRDSRDHSPQMRAIGPHQLEQLENLHASHNAQPRTVAFARWRYETRPGGGYHLHGWFEGEELRAFVVHRRTILKNMRTLAIVDAGARLNAHDCLAMLLREVCRHHRGDASLAASLMSGTHPARAALERNGFLPSPYRFNLLVQPFHPRFEGVMTEPWQLAWGDTDHL